MDEWMVSTPSVMSQHALDFPLDNPSIGGGNASLVFGLPVKDISMVLKPSTWPYFIFDIERAFAFSWNFNIFFFVISMFLLLMLLTINNFWLSAAGAFLVFFSSGIQWWSYDLSTNMIYLNGETDSTEIAYTENEMYSFIKKNQVRNILESFGYSIITFENGFNWLHWYDADC